MLIMFYGEQEYDRYLNWTGIRRAELPEEVYNGAYVYNTAPNSDQVPWSRADGCPCLIDDVPKVLRTMILILGE